jgi:hypothetical protein
MSNEKVIQEMSGFKLIQGSHYGKTGNTQLAYRVVDANGKNLIGHPMFSHRSAKKIFDRHVIRALEAEGMTTSDAQGVLMAADLGSRSA